MPSGPGATQLAEVVSGLARTPKSLPAEYMFDTVGARLFACLATGEDHYLARRELAVLHANVAEIASVIGADAQLVDLACGDGARTTLLATHLANPARIAVVDRVTGAASRVGATLGADRPDLPVLALDTRAPWSVHVPAFERAARTVAYLPLGLIGELEPRDAKRELQRLAVECGPRGALLVGIDLERDPRALEAAYADRAGVAASFNMNLLARINRELAGSFQLAAFDHRAVYDRAKGRVELHAVSRRWQWAAVHGHWFNFGAGEAVTTLVAYKYTLEWFSSLAASAGWNVSRAFLADDRKYALLVLES